MLRDEEGERGRGKGEGGNGTLEKMKPLLRLGVGVWGYKGIGSSYDAARQVLLLI
ncbi:hypothetical protein COO91_10466 (plasmid) [Nostoc flagelliforme CCNUN1]|uniref:Uncharacterized protein n=1 Tax=Nostoc flagelliforme CCNUN1 TaxID=2038116 RepID=A0A2K8T9H6_9NOSO|nr:hypothetical protein COO91_10466 [Nostoc flagelliforme CCNUN1]